MRALIYSIFLNCLQNTPLDVKDIVFGLHRPLNGTQVINFLKHHLEVLFENQVRLRLIRVDDSFLTFIGFIKSLVKHVIFDIALAFAY